MGEVIAKMNASHKPKVKICGLRRPEDIAYINEVRPDFAGFICFPKSFRYVDSDMLRQLKAKLADGIKAVGVFVNEEIEVIVQLAAEGSIDMIQLHGQEDETYIARLRGRTDKPLIKAFRIETAEDIKDANASSADYILLDHGAGGTGEAFDWSLLEDVDRPYFLAGGLNPENVQEAIARAGKHLFALDVSSGVETEKKKDREKIGRFMQTVQNL